MAKKKNTLADVIRQQVKKEIKRTGKQLSANAKKRNSELAKIRKKAESERDTELVARWRAMRKLGLINTKAKPSKKNLTNRLRSRIHKDFFEWQGFTFFNGETTQRPLVREIKTSAKTGRQHVSYKLNPNFHLIRTKKKTNAKTGVRKTSKGYIVQKSKPNSKFTINNKNELVESFKTKSGKKTKYRKRGYSGKEIPKLMSDIKSGKFTLKRDQLIAYRPWGSARTERAFEHDTLDMLLDMYNQYKAEMPVTVFDQWLDESELLIIDAEGGVYGE